MSNQIIVISLSDDEEETERTSLKKSPNKNDDSFLRKRKIPPTEPDYDKSKKLKVNEPKKTEKFNKSSTNLRNHDKTSRDSSNSEQDFQVKKKSQENSPKPGTSKYFDKIENHSKKKKSENRDLSNSKSSLFNSPDIIKNVIKPQLVIKQKVPIPDPSEDLFLKFITACVKKNDDKVTKKILDNVKKRYEQLNAREIDNEEFRLFLSSSITKITNSHANKFYAYIQEVMDEIKRRIIVKPKSSKCENDETTNREESDQDEDEYKLSSENAAKVEKLEKAIRKCQTKIKELEDKEVDFDDDDDSAYIQEDRYKRKLVELCAMISEIVGDKFLKKEIYKKHLRRKDISDAMTSIQSVDEAIINFVNSSIKKMNKLKHIKNPLAIADYLIMPDYPDILQCIIKCNNDKDLDLSKKKMEKMAETAFKAIGRYLKNERILESQDYISSYLDTATENDPAERDTELDEKLQKNKKDGDKRLNEIFMKYVDKQEGVQVEEDSEDSASIDDSEDERYKKKEKQKKRKISSEKSSDDEDNEIKENLINHKEKSHEKKKSEKDKKIINIKSHKNIEVGEKTKLRKDEKVLGEKKKSHQIKERVEEKKKSEKDKEKVDENKESEKGEEKVDIKKTLKTDEENDEKNYSSIVGSKEKDKDKEIKKIDKCNDKDKSGCKEKVGNLSPAKLCSKEVVSDKSKSKDLNKTENKSDIPKSSKTATVVDAIDILSDDDQDNEVLSTGQNDNANMSNDVIKTNNSSVSSTPEQMKKLSFTENNTIDLCDELSDDDFEKTDHQSISKVKNDSAAIKDVSISKPQSRSNEFTKIDRDARVILQNSKSLVTLKPHNSNLTEKSGDQIRQNHSPHVNRVTRTPSLENSNEQLNKSISQNKLVKISSTEEQMTKSVTQEKVIEQQPEAGKSTNKETTKNVASKKLIEQPIVEKSTEMQTITDELIEFLTEEQMSENEAQAKVSKTTEAEDHDVIELTDDESYETSEKKENQIKTSESVYEDLQSNENSEDRLKIHNNGADEDNEVPFSKGQETSSRPILRLKSFAKPPDSWKDSSSPEKNPMFTRSYPVDLTCTNVERSLSKLPNPLANPRFGLVRKLGNSPSKNMLVKRVIKNYNVSMNEDRIDNTRANNFVRNNTNSMHSNITRVSLLDKQTNQPTNRPRMAICKPIQSNTTNARPQNSSTSFVRRFT